MASESPHMEVLTVDGRQRLAVSSSEQRSLVGKHWAAIGAYRSRGELQPLRDLQGQRVAGHVLECDIDAIDEWLRQGALDIEDLYSDTDS